MTNPLSQLGWSNRDYQAAIGTLMGEALFEGPVGMAVVADVIANRMADGRPPDNFAARYGMSFADQALAKNAKGQFEFSTWSPKQANAYAIARAGFDAALNPKHAA